MVLWLNLAAALGYAFGALCMKSSEAFARPGASIGVFACFGTAATLQTFAMHRQDVSAGYVIVLGVEAIAAVALGVLFCRETMTPLRLVGVALVVAGVWCLRR
ncbi:MAG: hypothetical protein JNL08_19045 [Planctomycetes bacterium]|nr:hypothetical protein [Planctomycetota bacterium]